MTITIPDWLPMFLIYVGTCVNLWLAWNERTKTEKALRAGKQRLEKWNAAVTEAQAMWDYGARSEALEILKDASVTSEKPSAR